MNRAYSLLTVKAVDEEQRIIRGTATTPTPDRMGDIVEPLGVKYKNPLPLLWQHRSGEPVGTVRLDKPTEDGIDFEASMPSIAEPGRLKDRIDEAWQSVKLKLVRGVSIKFRELEMSFMDDGGIRFLQSEVLELSLVTIPANAEATIQQIKSIDTVARAASGRKLDDGRPKPPGVTGRTKPVRMAEEASMRKSIAEQIANWTTTRTQKAEERDKILDAANERGETLDADEKVKYTELDDAVKELDEHIARLRDREKQDKASAVAAAGHDQAAASMSRAGIRPAGSAISVRHNSIPGLGFAQLLAARFMAREDGISPADVAIAKGWSEDVVSVLRMPKSLLQKAAVAPATTTDSTWAGPLVVYQNLQNEFIELLRPKAVITRIPGLRKVPFNIKVPRETGAMTAFWVGQGSPKPVTKGALDTVTLDFAKVAGITYQTIELLRFSQPNSEQLLINSLTKAITYLVDRDFLDPAKALLAGVSPASITNGVTPVTATGISADAFRADFRNALAIYTMANYTLDSLVIIMTQTQALSLGLLRNDFGSKEFPDINKDGGFIEGVPVVTSENIVATGGSPADGSIIVFLNAVDILLADDGAVDVDISTEATIQADSAPDSPPTSGTVLVSLWQNNLVGIRCERFINWVKARTDSVTYINGANYR